MLRRVVDGLCTLVLPQPERDVALLRVLARELLAGYVFRPVMGFFAPFWVNKLLLAVLNVSQSQPATAAKPQGGAAAGAASIPAAAGPPREAPSVLDDDTHGLWDGQLPAEGLQQAAEPQPQAPAVASASVVLRASASETSTPAGADATAVDDADSAQMQRRLAASTGELAEPSRAAPTGQQPLIGASASMDGLDLASGRAGVTSESSPGVPTPPPTAALGPVRPSRAGALTARVTGSSVVGDSFSTHVSYELMVSDGAGARWLVQRRFSNFEALHKRIKPLRARGRYKLPPKRILYHGTEGGFMDTRKELLDRYLQDILSDARLSGCSEVWDFLSANSRSYVPAPGGGGVLKSVSLGLSAGLDSAVGRMSSGVHSMRAELADASRRLDRKLEKMKERWSDAEALASVGESESRGGKEEEPAVSSASAVGDTPLPPSSLHLSVASSTAGDEGYASSTSSEGSSSPMVSVVEPATEQVAKAGAAPPPPVPAPPPPAAPDLPPERAGDDSATFSGASSAPPADPSGLSLPLLDLVDAVFRLDERGWVQRRMLSFARCVAELFIGSAVDEALASKLAQLRRPDTWVRNVRWLRETLWPEGVWYRTRIVAAARAAGLEPPPTAPVGFGGVPPGREVEAAEDARAVCALLLQRSSSVAVERLIGRDPYRRGTLEVYHLLQSPLFVRQIGHSLLEAVLVRLRRTPRTALPLTRSRTLLLLHFHSKPGGCLSGAWTAAARRALSCGNVIRHTPAAPRATPFYGRQCQ